MVKLTIALAIFIMKYQGNKGKYYTIQKVSILLSGFFSLFVVGIIRSFTLKDNMYYFLLFLGVWLIIFLSHYTWFLRRRLLKSRLHYKEYKKHLFFFMLFIIVTIFLFIIPRYTSIHKPGKYLYTFKNMLSSFGAEFGLNKVVIFINPQVLIDKPDLATGQYSLNHEAGHFLYWAANSSAYILYRKRLEEEKKSNEGGHTASDLSGANAVKLGKVKDIEKGRMKLILIIAVCFFTSCSPAIMRTKEYKSGVKDLKSEENEKDLKVIPKKEIQLQSKIHTGVRDIDLLDPNVFAIRSQKTKRIFVFKFNKTDTYERFTCDSTWNLIVESLEYR